MSVGKKNGLAMVNWPVAIALLVAFVALWVYGALQGVDMGPLSPLYLLLGIFGATFANLSGAGGGVVFVPIFQHLGLTEQQTVASSFGIQAFGMTTGAVVWCRYWWQGFRGSDEWRCFLPIVGWCSLTTVAGIWSVYGGSTGAPPSLYGAFKLFSIVLGVSLLLKVLLLKSGPDKRSRLDMLDYPAILLIGYFGGVITAWLSVGVGEVLVFYLIIRGFCTTMSVAAAVVVTVAAVWSGNVYHMGMTEQTVWAVVLFAGPGAILGGILARQIATRISAKLLKTVLAVWILIMGLAA